MKITPQTLQDAAEQNIISREQADSLLEFIRTSNANTPGFSFTHVLYYLGGLVAIGAMTLFMNLGWESFGGAGIFMIALLYAGVGLKITNVFVSKGLHIPAGICATFVVCLTPLAIYGLQHWLNVWPDESAYREYHRYIKWHWMYMELGTLAVGAIVAWHYRYPFLFMPIAVTLWYMSMDVSVMISGEHPAWELRKLVTMYFGILMTGLALWVDLRNRSRADFAFWLYLFGVLTFWCGLTAQHSDSELSKFLYFCINLLMIGAGVLLVRRVFVIFGALGGSMYLGHLASNVFENSWLFPVALTAIGLGIIYLGVLWQKHERALSQKARQFLPEPLRALVEKRAP
ncbi:MAG: DUF2157 domain-containing protein [Pseudomonadota bacterium]